ncbi:hypothetical protein [Romboutsia lituseburensis]|uniref:hypothetical protein n=1 Tax=Romboutsia lituseburensis TaxID=1537 RepID=UPI00215B3F19|nr:hypothetical protein [Romboutsia lituseburensis]MCR8744997.1 hypothetical protein [Romboutsia lituseburensis]
MENRIYTIYKKEIENIKFNENVKAIFLVGSSKNVNLNDKDAKVNDIDIFVIETSKLLQVREVKNIEGIEFDINYFSEIGVAKFIKDREYFFLKEMSNPKIIYSNLENVDIIIKKCKNAFDEGPIELSESEKKIIKNEIKSKIDRLKNYEKLEKYEYVFLTNLYLKDIIVGYFSINRKWVPKDKKIMKTLKIEDSKLFDLVQNVQKYYKYEDLLTVYEYIFKNIDVSKNIKITY